MSKRKYDSDSEVEEDYYPVDDIYIKRNKKKETGKKLIVILDGAYLETVAVKKGHELLNCDQHKHIIKKHGLDPRIVRPDIAYKCLITLFSSPLNYANLLQVYIRTHKNVCISISPHTEIPRKFDDFCKLFVFLLHKLNVRAKDGKYGDKLMKVIAGPITDHLPPGTQIIGAEFGQGDLVHAEDLVRKDNNSVAVIIGAIAHGDVDTSYAEKTVQLSRDPLSAAGCCQLLCEGFANGWGIHWFSMQKLNFLFTCSKTTD